MFDSDLVVYACCRVSAAAAVVPSAFIARARRLLGRDVLLNIFEEGTEQIR
jgi:hypothetical protein